MCSTSHELLPERTDLSLNCRFQASDIAIRMYFSGIVILSHTQLPNNSPAILYYFDEKLRVHPGKEIHSKQCSVKSWEDWQMEEREGRTRLVSICDARSLLPSAAGRNLMHLISAIALEMAEG